MSELLLACRDCGQIHDLADRPPPRATLCCARCGSVLMRETPGGRDRALAYVVAALALFVIANMRPLFITSFEGAEHNDLIVSGALQLTRSGGAMAVLGVLVAMFSIVVPGLRFTIILAVLLNLRPPGRPPHRWLPMAWKTAHHLRRWAMLDVYLLGAFVAYTRLHAMVDTTIGTGGYALGALVLVQALLQRALAAHDLWDRIGSPPIAAPRPGEDWVQCPDCELVVVAPRRAAPAAAPARCPRCEGRLDPRKRASVAVTAALTLAAYVLYLPANLLPVMTLVQFGRTDTNTILSGVGELAASGLWPLALLVLFASIIVPVLKLAAMTWFLLAVRRGSGYALQRRTALYRLVEVVGRWSNIDVFMISILVALVRFGSLTTVNPGPGIISFAAVVILSMVATQVFDPRLMWDAAAAPTPPGRDVAIATAAAPA